MSVNQIWASATSSGHERNRRGPIVTSLALRVFRNVLMCCQTDGSHAKIAARCGCCVCVINSNWYKRRRKNRVRNPFTGSIWTAVSTQRKLCCNCKFELHVDWDMVPIMYGSFAAGPALSSTWNTSPNADALCKLSKMITDGSSDAPLLIDACPAICVKYCCKSSDDLWSTLQSKEKTLHRGLIVDAEAQLTWMWQWLRWYFLVAIASQGIRLIFVPNTFFQCRSGRISWIADVPSTKKCIDELCTGESSCQR